MRVIVTYKVLAHGKPVNFTVLEDRTSILSCTGLIYSRGRRNFISLQYNNNSAVFDALGLNAKEFVWEITGEHCEGSWPESSTLDKLGKVLEALECFDEF